jgi:hypothetical protein
MNVKQKKLLLVAIVLFELTVLVVPIEVPIILSGGDQFAPDNKFHGYSFLWNIGHHIAIEGLLVEWAGIFVGFIALFFYFDE